jgi:hypothetical protein
MYEVRILGVKSQEPKSFPCRTQFSKYEHKIMQGRTQGGGGCRIAAPSQTPQNINLKNTDFVELMISKVLHDLPFSRNLPLKSADD